MKILCALLIFCASSLTAVDSLVFETDKLADVYAYVEDADLIIFDIDNTLIEPAQTIGSDQWSWNRVKQLLAQGVSEPEAFEQTNAEWRKVHSITKMRTMEKETALIIQDLQAKGHVLMGLTLRVSQNEPMTRRELLDVGIDLSKGSVHSKQLLPKGRSFMVSP